MRGILNLLRGFALFGFVFMFLRWFIKGLFGKYFIIFWLWLILSVVMYYNHQKKLDESYDHRTGAEVWEEQYGKEW
jgi:hypothetical protein